MDKILKELFADGIEWTRPETMDEERLRVYKRDAEMMLASELFNNEFNRLSDTILYNTAMFSKSFTEVEQGRTALLALKRLKMNIETIIAPKKQPTNEDPHATI